MRLIQVILGSGILGSVILYQALTVITMIERYFETMMNNNVQL